MFRNPIHLITFGYWLLVAITVFTQDTAHAADPESGYRCTLYCAEGYGISIEDGTIDACANFPSCNPIHNCTPAGGSYVDTSKEGGFTQTICTGAQVCASGGGYLPVDQNGDCPAEPEGDDEDGDGNDCDPGEEYEIDCNDGDGDDTDTDGDGTPDSADGDDGICFTDVSDLPFEGENGETFDADCPSNCAEGNILRTNIPMPPYLRPPDSLCMETTEGNCLATRESGNHCNDLTAGGGDSCEYTLTGDQCDVCTTPSCKNETEDICSDGTTTDPSTGECVDIENFCQLDDDNDGNPDNADTFACGADCDPSEEGCSVKTSADFSCLQLSPPSCSDPTDPACAALTLDYELRCAVEFTDIYSCEEEFECSGNPLECATLTLQQKNYCQTQLSADQQNDPESLGTPKEGIDDGSEYLGGEGVEGSLIDLTDIETELDDSGYGLSRSCIADLTLTTPIKTFDIPLSELCNIFEAVGALVLALGFFFGFRIVASAF